MHKIHRSCLAVTLAVAMVLGMSPAQGIRAEETKKTGITAAETRDADGETKYERIDIGTAEEFADFASKCYLDAWSENKYVSLTADIDLTGTQLCVVPVFNGIFDGVGHTISGFDYLGDGYVVGLFRYVERDGMIQNLTLKGDIESANQRECIGSICGVNYGTIKNCTFQGTVSGRDTVGGIAGVNGGTGIITGCTAKGRITGYYSTGGIAGINHGVLNYCSNRAGINDDSAWVEEDDEMGTGMGILESLTENDDNELYSGVDTGGIAGFSDGMIVRCTNSGTVGYEHTGYNIGGIAGRQSGVVSHSTNNGTVYGRKDIGGIVGQMEPYIEIHEAESIRKAVNKLHDLIDKTIDDMQATKDSVKRDFDTLTVYSDSAVDAADVLAEQLGDFVDDNLDQVQAVTDRLDRVMAMTPEVLNDFEAAENSFTDAVQALKNISGDLGKMTDISDAPYDISSRKRITLLHTVGGYVVSSSYNPDAGEEVEITARTDGSSREYRLSRIEVVKVTNGETIASSTSDTCVFTMPAENVRVEAYFEPDAGILVQRKAAVIDDADAEQESPETETESEIETETETELETETETASKTETETGSDVETESGSDAETETGSDAETETGSDAETEGSTELDSATDNSSAESDRTEDDRVENNGNSSSGNRYDSTTPSDIAMPYGAGAAFLSGAFGDESEDDSGNGSAANKGGSINNSSNSTAAKASDSGSNTASGKNNGGNNTVVKASGSGNNTSDNKNNNINSIAGRVSDNSNNTAGGKNNGSNSTVSRASGSSNNTIEGNNNGSINDSGDNTLDSKNNGSNGTAGNASDSGNDASDEKDNNSNETGNAAGNKDPNTGDDTDNSSNDAADNKDNNSNSTANNNNNGSNDTADNKDNNSNNATDNKDNNTNDEDDGTDNSSDGTDSGKDPDTDKDSAATPDKDRRPAARAAATVRLTSNLSGNAGCTPNKAQDRAVVAVEPSGGYTVEYVTVDGTRIAPDSGNSYSFPVEGGETYEVYVHFRKVATRSGTVENAKSEIEYAIREAQDAANKIRDGIEANDEIDISELQKMLSATTTVMENTEILADIYGEQVAEALKAVNRDLGSTSDHLKSALDSVKAATRHTRDIVDYVNAQPDIRFAKLGAEYDYNRTNLHNQLQGISDSLKILSDNASNYSDVVNADLKAVNDQINVIFNLLADRLSDVQKLGLEEFYEDVSDEDIDSITTGRTESCSNRGIVKGDINVGGIAGSMSIDDEDPEDSAAGAIEYELGRRFITKCLVTGSVNEGYVTAKKNGAGGICGYMNHGIIVDSESYGSVESTEGDYVGGICGESLTIIKRCYALCSVTGNKNVGGIAGFADTLKNCYSMAEIQAENGRAGAIAGQVSGYDIADAEDGSGENAAKVVENYYVGENVHGIDNISYIGVAEPIAYEELLAVEQLPSQFEHLKVIYRIDDTYLGSEEVAYGAKLDRLHYPQIPAKEGCYGVWPDVSDRKMGGTFVVEGEYKDNVTVVQSGGAPEAADEGQWNRAYALIEDIFTEDTVLHAGVVDMDPPGEAAGKQHVVYEVTLENSGIKETDTFALRILNPYGDAAVYGYVDGTWTALESKNRGQYLQVVMTGTHAYFCVAEHTSDRMVLIICAAAAAVLIILTAAVKKAGARRKQKKLDKKRDQEEE